MRRRQKAGTVTTFRRLSRCQQRRSWRRKVVAVPAFWPQAVYHHGPLERFRFNGRHLIVAQALSLKPRNSSRRLRSRAYPVSASFKTDRAPVHTTRTEGVASASRGRTRPRPAAVSDPQPAARTKSGPIRAAADPWPYSTFVLFQPKMRCASLESNGRGTDPVLRLRRPGTCGRDRCDHRARTL